MKIVGNMVDDENEQIMENSEEDNMIRELYTIVKEIKREINSMSNRIRARRKDTRSGKGSKKGLDVKVDAGIEKERKHGEDSQTDKTRDSMSNEERIEEITARLIDDGISEQEARKTAEDIIKKDTKILFKFDELQGSNFFCWILEE